MIFPVRTALLLALPLLLSLIWTQTLLPPIGAPNFPSCARSCNAIQDAESSCIPATNEEDLTQCFCQSPDLSKLHISSDGTCDAWCPHDADRQQLMAWYQSVCGDTTATKTSSIEESSSQRSITWTTSTTTVYLKSNLSGAAASSSEVNLVGATSTNGVTVAGPTITVIVFLSSGFGSSSSSPPQPSEASSSSSSDQSTVVSLFSQSAAPSATSIQSPTELTNIARGIVGGIGALLFFAITFSTACCIYKRRNKKKEQEKRTAESLELENRAGGKGVLRESS